MEDARQQINKCRGIESKKKGNITIAHHHLITVPTVNLKQTNECMYVPSNVTQPVLSKKTNEVNEEKKKKG